MSKVIVEYNEHESRVIVEYNERNRTVKIGGTTLDADSVAKHIAEDKDTTDVLTDAKIVTLADGSNAPYIVTGQLQFHIKRVWNKDYQQNKECICGDSYARHFDPYERMAPVGCKYCECMEFRPKE